MEVKQFRDTDYYLTTDARVFHKTPTGKMKEIYGHDERGVKGRRIRFSINKTKIPLPRMMWETFYGEIPKGYKIGHRNGHMLNELGNLLLLKETDSRLNGYHPLTRKVIDLGTKKIYKGMRNAEAGLHHPRNTLTRICSGEKLQKVHLNIAWWDDVNDKAFRGDYEKYYNKYMKGKA